METDGHFERRLIINKSRKKSPDEIPQKYVIISRWLGLSMKDLLITINFLFCYLYNAYNAYKHLDGQTMWFTETAALPNN